MAVIAAPWRSQVQRIRLPQTMNNDPHNQVLDAYFWHFVDQGYPSATTPLFTGIQEGESLAGVIAREFGLPSHEAESAIEIARKEVAL